MKYFLDLGTHEFGGLEEFKEKLNIDKSFIVCCFEPNKDVYNLSRLDHEKIKKYENEFLSFKHYNLAVMNYSGDIVFNSHKGAWTNDKKEKYLDNYTTGANCLDINPTCDVGNGVVFDIVSETVKCVDISEIISSIVVDDPYADIYIKCDIEGSEFVVLPKLLDSKYINKVNKIYIEWHERFWYGSSDYIKKIHERELILERFRALNIETFVHT